MPARRPPVADKTHPSMVKVGGQPGNPRWTEFYDLYYPFVRTVAINQGLSWEDAGDVAQKIMVELSRKLGDFVYDPSKGSFRGFLKTVTRRRVMNWKNSVKPQHDPKMRVHQPPGQEGRTGTMGRIPDERLGDLAASEEDEWRAAIIRRALETLKARSDVNDKHYQIFEAIARQEPISKICADLDISSDMVSVVKFRLQPRFDEAVKEAQEYIDTPQIPDGDAR